MPQLLYEVVVRIVVLPIVLPQLPIVRVLLAKVLVPRGALEFLELVVFLQLVEWDGGAGRVEMRCEGGVSGP